MAPVATPLRALGSAIGDAGLGCGRVDARFSVVAPGWERTADAGLAFARGFVDPAGAFLGVP